MQKFHEIADVLTKITDKADMKKFVEEIFTKSERHDFERRWLLLKMLNEGDTQRAISDKLSTSLCKVTRGAKILREKTSMTYRLLNNRYPEEKID